MELLQKQLKELGLSDYEAKIYAVLLENSPSGASFIAKKCKLSRSTVYTALNRLIGKGLVGISYKNSVKQFIAQDPDILKEDIENKLETLEEIKNYSKLYKKDLNVPQITIFEGKQGLRSILFTMLHEASEKETMYVIRDESFHEREWRFIMEGRWQKIKGEKKIKTKILLNNSPAERRNRLFYKKYFQLETKYLPRGLDLDKFTLIIIGDTVVILSLENNNLIGLKITNAHLAHNFITLFKVIYKS